MKNACYNFPKLKVSSYILFCLTNGPKPIQFILMYDKENDSNAHIREARTRKSLAF